MADDDFEDALPCYGHFLGGDPRAFSPDPEGLVREELDAWVAACEAAEKDGKDDLDGAGRWFAGGGMTMHVTMRMFGLGVTHPKPLENWRELAAELRGEVET